MAKTKFGSLLLLCQGILVILYCVFVEDGNELLESDSKEDGLDFVGNFRNLHISAFLGLGLAMTFLRRYSRGMLVHVILIGALVVQWATLLQGFFTMNKMKIDMNLMRMVNAEFAVFAVLISIGAVMGKCNSLQLLTLAMLETLFFAVNETINLSILKASDFGRSMIVHVFGSFFGLGVSRVIYSRKVCTSLALSMSPKSEMFTYIGTLVLWTYWPNVNALLLEGICEKRALVNTFYSLAACCTATFSFTVLQSEENKFNVFHLQNAILAGGVAIGSIAAMSLSPWGAVIVGIVGSLGTILGYKYCTPILRRNLKIHDTKGVFPTHGIPGILSGLASVLVAFLSNEEKYRSNLYVLYPARAPTANSTKLIELQKFAAIPSGENRTAPIQAAYQLACLGITVVLAVVGGLITGLIIRIKFFDPVSVNDAFDDHDDFEEKNCIDMSIEIEYDDNNGSVQHDLEEGMIDSDLGRHENGRDDKLTPGNSGENLIPNNNKVNKYVVPQIHVTADVELKDLHSSETDLEEQPLVDDAEEDKNDTEFVNDQDVHSSSI